MNYITVGELRGILATTDLPDGTPVQVRAFSSDDHHWTQNNAIKVFKGENKNKRAVLVIQGEVV